MQGDYEGYVVGLIVTCEPVPNKDNLSVLKVDIGSGTELQIVTNAPNVSEGKRVVVATVGSKVRLLHDVASDKHVTSQPYSIGVVTLASRFKKDET